MSASRTARARRRFGVAAVVGVLALLSTACSTPSTPNPTQPGGSSFTFRATRAEVVSHNDTFLQGTRDEPFVYNVWFRVKLGVPNSAQVGVAGSRDSASMSLGNGESRYLFSEAEQGAVRFDNVRLLDAGDLLNPQNHLEVVGSWTWAMEEDNISVKGLTDKTAQILKNTLNSTLATMSLPSDTGALVSQIMGSIPQAFTFFAGAAFASIPGLTDDVVGSNIYAGVAATGTLASVLDAATESFKVPFIEIPIVSIPPDIGLNPGGGGHIFSLASPKTFTGEDFSQWNSGAHRYDLQMVPTGTPLDLSEIYNARYDRCVDLSYGNVDGGRIDPWPCNGNGRQAWMLTSAGEIRTPVKFGRCMDAGSGAVGGEVWSASCNGSAGQRWRIDGSQIVNDAQGKCLGIPGQPVSGTHLKLRTCLSTDTEQQWVLKPLAPANYQRIRNTSLDRCAGVVDADTGNGAALDSWMCTNAPDQGWVLDPSGFIFNRGSDRCLDGNGGEAGAEVRIYNCADVPWQRWEWTGTQLVNSYRNRCLAVKNNELLPGAKLNLVACDPADPAQKMVIEPATPWSWSQLRNPSTTTCAQVADNDPANGKLVLDAPCESYAATGQGWRLDPAGLVISRIDAGAHGKCLDAGTGAAGAQVLSWDCHGQPNQRWHVAGSQLVSDIAGMCLTSASTPGGPLRLGACDGSASQRWVPTLQ